MGKPRIAVIGTGGRKDGAWDSGVARAAEARRSELKAIEWKPLWGKPAGFALVVMVIFLALFKQTGPKKTEPTSA